MSNIGLNLNTTVIPIPAISGVLNTRYLTFFVLLEEEENIDLNSLMINILI